MSNSKKTKFLLILLILVIFKDILINFIKNSEISVLALQKGIKFSNLINLLNISIKNNTILIITMNVLQDIQNIL